MARAPGDRLRVLTCGSVDDGKSTLMGRLMHDVGAVPEDVAAAAARPDGALDFAALVDGLMAEKEQGITIDVAHRYVSTSRRELHLIDAPGHEQYTRNMVTGASQADVALVLIDAVRGTTAQTRRHALIAALTRVPTVIFVVTKMDAMGWDRQRFDELAGEAAAFASALELPAMQILPVSGVTGENVARSAGADWVEGGTLLDRLEAVGSEAAADVPFRMPVQWVRRDGVDRAYVGKVAAGRVQAGDVLRVQPSGRTATVVEVAGPDGPERVGQAGLTCSLTLDRAVDVARGDVLTAADAPLEVADQFEIDLVWMGDDPLLPGRVYDLKIGARTVAAQVTEIRRRVSVEDLAPLAARTLELNDVGVCNLSLGAEIAFAPYAEDRTLGGFILIDRATLDTVGAGMIRFALRRAHNVHRQALTVDATARAAAKGQKPTVLWFTGLSGAGKSTIADAVERRLHDMGRHTYLIDGDNLRHGLTRDLGFTDADRVENIRRAAETARLMADAGLIVLVSLISPFAAERRMARDLMGDGRFVEVFVDVPLAVAEARDVKGLYRKARAGQLANFTGIDSPYERPEAPEVHLRADAVSAEDAAERVVKVLLQRGRLQA
ncbi:MAG TPA: adenylyl-sulfate kinase [Brevundimonas sp.]|jgi:bifunctional enzyme CysN/CysC|uniref:adenylyl-sulfate kinase n=1 Tax=Brevundimonas sp. TaxID=1871086 RepID=UPI002DEFDF32|nr:adenylyl-sulfate kinase [Brevundimonas sp.]